MEKELKICRAQQGMVLIITLLILMAMMLITAAMMRSTDTAVFALGNMMTRQQAEGPVHFAIERVLSGYAAAAAAGVPPPFVQNTILAQDNRGVPNILLSNTPAPVELQLNVPGENDYTIRAVVEQMCRIDAAGALLCMTGAGGGGSTDTNMDGELTITGGVGGAAVVRITIRVDGPKNTVAFAQAFLS